MELEITQPALFEQLDTETRIVVEQEDKEFDRNMSESNISFIEACKNLQRIHGVLKYKRPGFEEYCQGKELPTPTAYKMLNVAEMSINFIDIPGGQFGKSALYLLAAPSTPSEARQEAIGRALNGETITHSTVKDIINGYKSPSLPEAFPDDRRPYTLYPDGHKEFVTLEGIQRTRAMLDEKGIGYFTCDICGDIFDNEVWHCAACDSHWPASLERCKNCYQDRQAKNDYNYLRDNRRSTVSDPYTPLGMDACQTPAYAVDPLLPYLPEGLNVWEPACGEGLLEDALIDSGFSVVSGDILTGQNFFDYEPDRWDCLVTNPPYSIHFQWLERCYELGKPFALLLKVDILGTKTAQEMFGQYGIEVIFVSPRINYKMPRKGWDGGGAQFSTAWFTWGLEIGQQMTFAKIVPDE